MQTVSWPKGGCMVTPTGTPSTTCTGTDQQHVFYVGTDNGLYHVFYNPDTGSHSDTERRA